MDFNVLPIAGAFLVVPRRHEDNRGFFARTWCAREFEANGLDSNFVQCSISFNRRRGTLRGMHYQLAPSSEAKLVRCTRGAVYDVLLDLRKNSPTFGHWHAVELTQANHSAIYIPHGIAHGFQTLEDNTELTYQMTDYHQPSLAEGVRWNDPRFEIRWPISGEFPISPRDRDYPLFAG